MKRSVVVKVSLLAIDSEPIDSMIGEFRGGKIVAQKFLESEIPGIPGVKFQNVTIMPYASDAASRRLLHKILIKAYEAAMEEPKDLILAIEVIR